MSRQVATPGLARSRGATRVCSGEQTPGLISSPAIVPRQQEIDYENERKANLVSSQEIWLWLGAAVRVAGLGCYCGFCGIACHRGHALAARAFRPLDCGGYRFGNGHDYYLPGERRATTLALGKGLTFAYDYANHSPGASRRWRWPFRRRGSRHEPAAAFYVRCSRYAHLLDSSAFACWLRYET